MNVHNGNSISHFLVINAQSKQMNTNTAQSDNANQLYSGQLWSTTSSGLEQWRSRCIIATVMHKVQTAYFFTRWSLSTEHTDWGHPC